MIPTTISPGCGLCLPTEATSFAPTGPLIETRWAWINYLEPSGVDRVVLGATGLLARDPENSYLMLVRTDEIGLEGVNNPTCCIQYIPGIT
jgi:hypothetical protein